MCPVCRTVSVDIREIRPGEYQEVESLIHADQQGDSGQEEAGQAIVCFARCQSVLSLVAHDGGQVVGAVVCYWDPQQGYLYELAVAESHRQSDLAKALVDKALRKLNAQGTHKCRIRLSHDTDQYPFWDAVRWTDRPELTKQPVPSSAVIDRLVAQATGAPESGDDPKPQPGPEDEPAGEPNAHQDEELHTD